MKPLTISANLERQIIDFLADQYFYTYAEFFCEADPLDARAQKARYLLDQLDKARKGTRT